MINRQGSCCRPGAGSCRWPSARSSAGHAPDGRRYWPVRRSFPPRVCRPWSGRRRTRSLKSTRPLTISWPFFLDCLRGAGGATGDIGGRGNEQNACGDGLGGSEGIAYRGGDRVAFAVVGFAWRRLIAVAESALAGLDHGGHQGRAGFECLAIGGFCCAGKANSLGRPHAYGNPPWPVAGPGISWRSVRFPGCLPGLAGTGSCACCPGRSG